MARRGPRRCRFLGAAGRHPAGAGVSIRVLLADDQVLIRSGFAALIASSDDLVVVGEAGDGAQAVARVRELRPDVVLMDVRMPGTDGLTATQQITGSPDLAEVRVI